MQLLAAVAAFVLGARADTPKPSYRPVHFHGCVTTLARSFPYCDASLPYEARAAWLVTNMTLAEKIGTQSVD